MKWRDLALTILAWIAFLLVVDAEFQLIRADHNGLVLFQVFGADASWRTFIAGLMPFLLIAVALGAMLVVFGSRTILRRRRALGLPQPAPLDISDEAQRAGLDAATLLAARAGRIVIVHIDADGRHRIEVAGG